MKLVEYLNTRRQTRAARRLMQTIRTMYGEKSEFIEDIFTAEADLDVSLAKMETKVKTLNNIPSG